jgi:hypothetical protein
MSYTSSSDCLCPKGTGDFTREVSGRGVYLTVLLVVPRLKIPGAVFPRLHASSWRSPLLSTNTLLLLKDAVGSSDLEW